MDCAVRLIIRGAFLAVALSALTGLALSTDANAVADFDVTLSLGSDTDGNADDFMADTAGVFRRPLCPLVIQPVNHIGQHTHPLLRVCKSDPQIPQ